jgi:hypothetical protein
VNQYQLIEFTENYIDNIHVTNIANSLYRKSLYEFTKDIIKTTPEKEAYLASDYYQRLFYEDQGEVAEIDFVNKYIAADQPLYLLIGKTTLEYALFGINKTRDLYPSQNLSAIPSGSYVLVAKQLQLEQKNRILIGEDNDYAIYLVP